ncbi:MAG: hypothetical protein ACP5FT_00415 [Acidilobus sp.]
MAKGASKSEGFLQLINRFSLPISIALALAMTALSVFIRLTPAFRYGLKYVNGNDPWIFYWLAKYFYEHGVSSQALKALTDVKVFWYPWGRNFLVSEYLGLPILTAIITKLMGKGPSYITAVEGLLPVAFSAVGILGTFFAAYKITDSKLGALAAASVFAFYPVIVIDKSFATYPGKQVTGLAIIALALYFWASAYKSPSRYKALALALVGGLIGGSIAWLWGGYEYVALIMAVIILLDPFLVRPTPERFMRHFAAFLGYLLAVASSPAVGVRYFYHGLGLALVGVLLVYLFEAFMERLPLDRLHLTRTFNVKVHLWIILLGVGLLVAASLSGLVFLPSRVLLALGIVPATSGIVPLTVQEYMPISLSQAMAEYGPVLFVTIIGIIAFIYVLAARRERLGPTDTIKVALFVLGVLFTIASVNEAYFAPSAAFFLALSAAASISIFTSMKVTRYDRKTRKATQRPDVAGLGVGLVLAIIVLGFAAYYAPQVYATMKLEAPAVTTGWLSPLSVPTPSGRTKIIVPLNSAWLDALNYVKHNTSPNAVIVSWWDYGYWIEALGNRTTVDDGSTINGTQIEVVANVLTAPVNQSGAFLRMLRVPPNDTYVLVYDVFVGIYTNQTRSAIIFPYPNVIPVSSQYYFVTYGLGDIAKSYQMLRIAQRVNPFFPSPFFSSYTSVDISQGNVELAEFPGFVGGPSSNVSTVLNTTIYDLMLYGIEALKQYGVITGAPFLNNATSFVPAAIQYVDPTTGSIIPQPISPPDPEPYYVPVKVFMSVFYYWSPPGSGQTYFYSVIVFLYKWTGKV